MMLLLGLVALCVAWLVPGHFYPWTSFQQEFVAGVGAVCVGLAALSQGTTARVRWPAMAVATLAIAAIPMMQLWLGLIRFHSDAVLATLYVAGFALAMVAGARLVRTRRDELIGGLFAAFLIAGLVSTGLAVAQWLNIGPIGYVGDMPPGGRPYANLAQPNHLASLIALAIMAVLWCFESRRIGVTAAALAVGWLGLGLVSTQSRAGWLLVLAISIATLAMRRRITLRTTATAIGAGLALFAVALLTWGPLSDALMLSVQSFEQRAQPGPRGLLWRALIDALGDSPWAGYGWTQVGLASQAAAMDHVTQRGTLNQSHNLVLDLFLWNGIPLGLLIVSLLVRWFLRQFRRCRDAECWIMLAAVGTVFVHELVEFPLEYAYFLMPVGLLMGALDGLDEGRAWQLPRASLAAPLLLSAGMLGWIAVEYMKVEEAARQVRFVVAGIGVDKVSTAAPPDVWLLDSWREIHKFWLVRPRAGMTDQELDWMRLVQERYAVPPFQARYALALAVNGRADEASQALVRLCHMHRRAPCEQWYHLWVQLQANDPALKGMPFPEDAKRVLAIRP